MSDNLKFNYILRGVAGILLSSLGLLLFYFAPHSKAMRFDVPVEELVAKADAVLSKSTLAEYNLPRHVRVDHNESLSRYAQVHDRDSDRHQYSPILISVLYQKSLEIEFEDSGIRISSDTDKDAKLRLTYDANGVLRGFVYQNPLSVDSSKVSDGEALEIANLFLQLNGFDFQLNRDHEEVRDIKRGVQSIKYVHEMPISDALVSKYSLKLIGKKVASFENKVSISNPALKKGELMDTANTGVFLVTLLVWLFFFVVMMIQFFRRMKHEEIEFRRAFWVGLLFGLFIFLAIYASTGFEWDGLLGGFFGGGFFGGLVMLMFAVSDAYGRDHDPDKIALSDLLLQGHVRIRETGYAILNGLWIAGITFLAAALVAFILEQLQISYFVFKDEDQWIFADGLNALQALDEWLPNAAMTTLTALLFAPLYLRNQLKNSKVLTAVISIVFALLGLHLFQYEPTWISVLATLPLAWYWAKLVFKYELVTLFVGLLMTSLYFSLSAIRFVPDGYSNIVFVAGSVIVVLLFAAGIFFSFSDRGISDYKHYIPPYVSMMAEKQRIFNELEVARNIQSRFLPQENPSVPGLDIASICRPAMEVGGDYYDFVHVNNDLHVIVGDVSGKGVSAAFYMTMTKGIVKTLAKSIRNPAKMLSEINEVFYKNTPRNIFISLLYGVFDMEKRELCFARGGHNPLLVRKKSDGSTLFLTPGGLAIGLDNGDVFNEVIQEESIPFLPGDLFVFYTDGISESMNAQDEEFGDERLSEVLNKCVAESAAEAMEKINSAIGEFTGDTAQHDDFTMVIVKIDEKL
ncbi:MAG: PP2C family protein-serine/threonine phosphatase [Calditrichia bacterium]